MNSQEGDLSVESLSQARRYFKKMKKMYHQKLSEYVQELTFISEKLTRYDEIVLERQKRRG
jgi:kinesin family member 6/9